MRYLLTGVLSLCLTACAAPLKPLPPTLLPAGLTEPCAQFQAPTLQTNGDLARAYVAALGWGAECRARHKALARAVSP